LLPLIVSLLAKKDAGMIEIEKMNTGEILVYGHRGAGFSAPENTMASFQMAYAMDVDMIELDVRLTQDDELVVMHDHQVSRTTNGTGSLAEMTLSEVKQLDAGSWFNGAFAGEPVPTLMEVLTWAKGKIELLIEIKGSPQPQNGIEEAVISAIRTAGMEDSVLVKSFFHRSIQRTRQIDPQIPTGILYASALVDPVAAACSAGADSLRNLVKYWTREAVHAAHEAGLQTSAWKVNDLEALENVLDLGLDSFGTDNLQMAVEFLSARGVGRTR